jgi:hypothetical protein
VFPKSSFQHKVNLLCFTCRSLFRIQIQSVNFVRQYWISWKIYIFIQSSCSLISLVHVIKKYWYSNRLCFILYIFVLFTAKKQPLKNFNDIKQLIQQGKKREVKLLIRENTWPVNSTVRSQLWPELCATHQHGKNMVDGFYWDMVNQVISLIHFIFNETF